MLVDPLSANSQAGVLFFVLRMTRTERVLCECSQSAQVFPTAAAAAAAVADDNVG